MTLCPQVTLALDRGAREKEMAAQLLSAAYPDHVRSDGMAKGFIRLIEGTSPWGGGPLEETERAATMAFHPAPDHRHLCQRGVACSAN